MTNWRWSEFSCLDLNKFQYFQDAEVAGEDVGEVDPFMEVSNSSILEEEHFNTKEHRGFLHGFVESLSVILVLQKAKMNIPEISYYRFLKLETKHSS